MLEPDHDTMQQMARVAESRAQAWRLFEQVVLGPTPELVAQLRDGRFLAEVRKVSRWAGEDNPLAEQESAMQTMVDRSHQYSLEDDLVAITAEWERVFDQVVTPEQQFAQAAVRCEEEAAAWAEGDHQRAKELRMSQFTTLQNTLEPMVDWCVHLKRTSRLYVGWVLARVVAAHLSVESGRDVVALLPA